MGENRIFVGHVVCVYGGLKKFMAIIGGLHYEPIIMVHDAWSCALTKWFVTIHHAYNAVYTGILPNKN